MSKGLLSVCLLVGTISIVAADGLISFPYQSDPCTCVLLTCTCCTGVKVQGIGFSKNVCVVINIKLFPVTINLTIKLDTKQLAQLSFSATNPPTYCVPILLPVNVSMCLKIHDIKLVNLINVQMCMTLYAGYDGSNVFVFPFNCVKVGAGTLSYFTTTSTTPKST